MVGRLVLVALLAVLAGVLLSAVQTMRQRAALDRAFPDVSDVDVSADGGELARELLRKSVVP